MSKALVLYLLLTVILVHLNDTFIFRASRSLVRVITLSIAEHAQTDEENSAGSTSQTGCTLLLRDELQHGLAESIWLRLLYEGTILKQLKVTQVDSFNLSS